MVVGTIIFAKVPLHRNDIVHFMSPPVEGELIDLILNKLSSVISIGETDGLIHTCHLSFSEFLCDPTQSTRYFVDHDIHSPRLAGSCFRLMNANLRFNICGLETSHLRNSEVKDLAARIKQCIPACLSYACRFVAKHLRETDNGMPIYRELLAHVAEFLHG
jgi:hypothetical protein